MLHCWWIHNLDLCSNVRYYSKLHQCYWKNHLYWLPSKITSQRPILFTPTRMWGHSLFSILKCSHTVWAKKTFKAQHGLMFWLNCHFVNAPLFSPVWHSLLVSHFPFGGRILFSLITETDGCISSFLVVIFSRQWSSCAYWIRAISIGGFKHMEQCSLNVLLLSSWCIPRLMTVKLSQTLRPSWVTY